MSDKISVIIVDDHPMMRHGIKVVIEKDTDIQVIGEANTCESAIQKARELMPDVILMDLSLPDGSGIEAIIKIRTENPAARVLVFSNYSDDKNIYAAMEAGAMGYLVKVNPPEMIVKAIQEAFHGKSTLSSQAEHGLLMHLRNKKTKNMLFDLLTEREIEILRLMGKGMTNAAMAEKTFISEGTVRTHISNILTKLNLKNRAQAVIFAVKEGLVKLEDDD